ncbi:MAG: crotonase/enoyl-CoA hydratase family protein [Cyclobacteriaceae bacterium]|nr:crotonase/enoyl-CoA hydratase family protein [Cyclobacteriaceae bacterium]
MGYAHFQVTVSEKIARVSINRPQKANALHLPAWEELKAVMEEMGQRADVRVVVLSGEGKLFCAGIDLELLMSVQRLEAIPSAADRRESLYAMVIKLQDCVSSIERCRKPVMAAIHNGCIGGGVDIIAACDLRYCSEDAYFVIKEIDMGMVADLGTLQRLPKFMRPASVAEMAYTGRAVKAREAVELGLVNACLATREEMLSHVEQVALQIASKSPASIRGTKEVLRHAADHPVAEGLEYIARHNAEHLLSDDLKETFRALMEKRTPRYND